MVAAVNTSVTAWLKAVMADTTLPSFYRLAALELSVLATCGHPSDPERVRIELTDADVQVVRALEAQHGARRS